MKATIQSWIMIDWQGRKYGGSMWDEVLKSMKADPWIKIGAIRTRVKEAYGVVLPSTNQPEMFVRKLIELGEVTPMTEAARVTFLTRARLEVIISEINELSGLLDPYAEYDDGQTVLERLNDLRSERREIEATLKGV